MAAAAIGLVAGCGGDGGDDPNDGEGGEAASGSAGSGSPAGSGGAGGAGSGGATGAGGDPAESAYPDLATLHALGVAPTCSLNDGVCHSSKQYPNLDAATELLDLIGAPCQIGASNLDGVPDECEIPGDRLVLGGKAHEVLRVTVDPGEAFPPKSVRVRLADAPASLDPNGAVIERPAEGQQPKLSKSLAGVTIASGGDPQTLVLGLAGASDPSLRDFLDTRTWKGDRVRMGDPNGNGIAHAAEQPWRLVVPGDPSRSFFYKRLITDQFGAMMPLIPRTWSAAATRAVWCWIRGLPADATPASVSLYDPIDYESCPIDPEAPDPGQGGGWGAVKALMGSRCATAPCHSAETHSEALDLTPDAATFAKYVINVPSTQQPGALRVVPGQPAASYLLCKVDPACENRAPETDLMPVTGMPLTAAEIKTISDWIAAGAPVE